MRFVSPVVNNGKLFISRLEFRGRALATHSNFILSELIQQASG